MKKIILILIIVLATIGNGFSEPFIKFEVGNSLINYDMYFMEGIVGYKFNFWNIESRTYGGWLTWTYRNNITNNSPFMDIYSIGQKFIYRRFFVHFKHYCAHAVNSNKNFRKKYDSEGNYLYTRWEATPYWWAGSMRTISAGFEWEFK